MVIPFKGLLIFQRGLLKENKEFIHIRMETKLLESFKTRAVDN
jgi:hypothetical protein